MIPVRQSTAFECSIGPVLDADGVAVTDCVVGDFKLKKTTGNFAALNGSATLTHVSAGTYDLVLTTSDLDTVGLASVAIDDTVNACAPLYLQVMEEAIYDALYAASANAWSGAAGSSIGVSNVTQIGGDAQSATDLKDFADAGYDPATNKVQGVVLVDTCTLTTTTSTATAVTTVNGLAANVITATSIASDAIAAAKIATGAITAAKFAAGAIDAAAIANGAIDAATFAAGAIDAAALAADAGTEIGTAVWATTTRILTHLDEDTTTIDLDSTIQAAVGLASANLDTQLAALPTAGENADAVWDEDATGHQTGGTFGQAIGDPAADTNTIYGAVVTAAAGATVAADIIAIKAETAAILDDTDDIGVAGAGLTEAGGDGDHLTAINLPNQTMDITGNITGNLSGSVGSVTGAVGSVTGAVGSVTGTIGGLTAAALKDFFDTDSATDYASAVAGSVVKEIADNAGGGTPPTAEEIADEVETRTIAGVTLVATTTNLTNLPTIPANWLTAAGTHADFTTEIQSGLATAAELAKVPKSDGTATWNATALGSIQSEANDALVAYDPPTNAELVSEINSVQTDIAALNNLSSAQAQSAAEAALVTHRLDELLNADSDIDGAAPPTVGSVFHELMSKTAGSFTFDQTTDSNEAIRDRGDAAWITATGFSTHSASDVWAVGTRVLTAGTNIALAKGTGVTGFNDLSAAQVNAEVDTALADYDGPTNAEMEARTIAAADYFDPAADTVAHVTLVDTTTTLTNKTGFALTTAYDLYHADVHFTRDQANTTDEYTVTWFKNGVRVTSGITVPTIQVVKRADGTDLIASTALSEIGSTGSYKLDASGANRLTVGEAVVVVVSATIDGSPRPFSKNIGRDST